MRANFTDTPPNGPPRSGTVSQATAISGVTLDHLVDPTASGGKWRAVLPRCIMMAAVVLGIYAPVINPWQPADLLFDDAILLTKNDTVQHRLSRDPSAPPAHLATLAKLWLKPDGPDYFPLTETVLWAQWPFFSTSPPPDRTGKEAGVSKANHLRVAWSPGYHATNVLLHLAGVFSLWWLLSVMRVPGAFLGASLFAVHPVCVESAAWVSELKNTLSLPLFLLAAADYVRSDKPHGDGAAACPLEPGTQATVAYVRSVVLFALGMLAKTSLVFFPLVILLYAWWKRATLSLRDLRRATPFFAISLSLGLVTLWFQTFRAIGDEKLLVGGLWSRIAAAGMAILWYLRLILWPYPLLPSYPKWEVDPPHAWQFLPWVLIAAATIWCWQHRDGWGRHVILGMGFFLLMVAPVLGFVNMSFQRISWTADHFIYAPLTGIASLVAAGITVLYGRSSPRSRPLIVAGTAIVLIAYACLTFYYAGLWANADRLWKHTLRWNDRAWIAHLALGIIDIDRNRIDDVEPGQSIDDCGALTHMMRATALCPDWADNRSGLGIAYAQKAEQASRKGDAKEAEKLLGRAIEELSLACQLAPNNSSHRRNIVKALSQTGRIGEMENHLITLLQQESADPAIWNEYGICLAQLGRLDEAIQRFRHALAISPGFVDAQRNLAKASAMRARAVANPRTPVTGTPSMNAPPDMNDAPTRVNPAGQSPTNE